MLRSRGALQGYPVFLELLYGRRREVKDILLERHPNDVYYNSLPRLWYLTTVQVIGTVGGDQQEGFGNYDTTESVLVRPIVTRTDP